MNSDYENAIIQKLISFGESHDAIRAMVLTSSLCNPNAPADILSDFDIEIFFEDPAPFVESDEWIETIGMGPAMALWHWPNPWDHEEGDGRHWMRMVYYQDGTKMDITLGYLADLREISNADTLPDGYDIGYRVILDKDGATAPIKPPGYRAFIIGPPSREQFAARMEAFWMNSTYVAKYLWRDDLMAAKWMLHELADRGVREVLEWSVAMECGWTYKQGNLGRGLAKALHPEAHRELIESYAAGDMADLWESLFRTTALYRKTAARVAGRLGFEYPHNLDERVSALHRALRDLDRKTATREELAALLSESHGNG